MLAIGGRYYRKQAERWPVLEEFAHDRGMTLVGRLEEGGRSVLKENALQSEERTRQRSTFRAGTLNVCVSSEVGFILKQIRNIFGFSGEAYVSGGVHPGARFQQLCDDVVVPHLGGYPKRSGAVRPPRIGLGTLREEVHQYLVMAVLCGYEEGSGPVLEGKLPSHQRKTFSSFLLTTQLVHISSCGSASP